MHLPNDLIKLSPKDFINVKFCFLMNNTIRVWIIVNTYFLNYINGKNPIKPPINFSPLLFYYFIQ